VREVFDAGADIVSIGSAAFLNPELIVEACGEFPGRVFGSVDVRDGRIAIKGWVETTELGVSGALERLRRAGVAAVTLTDVARDGTETGADVAMFSKVAEAAGVPIIASGGVAAIEDLRALKALFAKRVVGAITGRALYEGRFTLREATSTLDTVGCV
jgi:phosphoribosylformimino-5-aminoimidazole carboxamide ribotide isomerase